MNLHVNIHDDDLKRLMVDDRVPMKQVGVDLLIDKPTFLQRIDTHPNLLNQDDLNVYHCHDD